MAKKRKKQYKTMTVKELKKAIRKQERQMMRSYKAMMTHPDKAIRKTEVYQRYSEFFRKTRSGLRPKNPLSGMKKADLMSYYDKLMGVSNQEGSTLSEYKKRRRAERKKALEKGASKDLLKFIDKNLDMWDKFINSGTFQDSIGVYAYESDLWDKLRDAKEEDKSQIFIDWLEEKEDEWAPLLGKDNAEELIHYSDYVNEDNWKKILNRLAEEW